MRIPLVAADPGSRRGHIGLVLCTERLGKVYQHLGQFEQAIEVYDASLRRLNAYVSHTGDRSMDNDIAQIRTQMENCRKRMK
jgi:hypothetical protein